MNFDLVYINLEEATERRAFVEKSFSDADFSTDWTIRRFRARTIDDVYMRETRSSIRPGQTGCFASHIACLEQSLTDIHHLVIAEDDVVFSPSTETQIRRAVDVLGENDWDMLFTDVCIPNAADMLSLFLIRRELIERNQLQLRDLSTLTFAGSTCYVVNARSKSKLHAALLAHRPFTRPYDLYVRDIIREGALKAFAVYPFLTSLSDHSDVSQIQTTAEVRTNMLWDSFRRLVWIDANADAVLEQFESVRTDLPDRPALAFSKIMQGMVAKDFRVF